MFRKGRVKVVCYIICGVIDLVLCLFKNISYVYYFFLCLVLWFLFGVVYVVVVRCWYLKV